MFKNWFNQPNPRFQKNKIIKSFEIQNSVSNFA